MTKKLSTIKSQTKNSFWHTTSLILLWLLTIIACAGLIAASYGGNIAPDAIKGICLMVMTFPAWLLLMVLATVLDILWCRKALVLCLFTYIACASAIWEYSPLNIRKPSLDKYAKDPIVTFLTYNVTQFNNLSGTHTDGYNATVSYILKVNADIVNLQEASLGNAQIPAEQMDSLHKAYPYILQYSESQALLSKYPAESIHTPGQNNRPGNEVAIFRLNIEGEQITLINVHLQSYGLTDTDKELYKDITKLDDQDGGLKNTIKDVRHTLLAKIQNAVVQRKLDTERVCSYIDHFGGPNVIVAGDFNDVPGCYALRRLAEYKMHEAYSELGFGPMITFNADRFYFRIDHVLYRGALKPLRMSRGNLKLSDHYPLLVTFAVTHPEKI